MKWEPIETVPFDTEVYVWLPRYDAKGPVIRTRWTSFWWNEYMNGSVANEAAFKPKWWMKIERPE